MESQNEVRVYEKRYRSLSLILPVLNIACVLGVNYFYNGIQEIRGLLAPLVFVLCFSFFELFFIDLNKEKILCKGFSVPFITFGSVFAFMVCAFSAVEELYAIIILIAAVFSAIIRVELSMIVISGCVLYFVLFAPQYLNELSIYIVMALFIGVLSRSVSEKVSFLYSLLTDTAVYIIMLIICNGFSVNGIINQDSILLYAVTLAVVVTVFMIKRKTESSVVASVAAEAAAAVEEASKDIREEENEANKNDEINELSNRLDALKVENDKIKEQYKSLSSAVAYTIEAISSFEAEFLVRIKREAPKLFKHCTDVAELSSEAADLIGCDSEFAYAIALYHEAGRIAGDNYADVLKRDYKIPRYIVNSVQQIKNKNNTKPVSREAGIVMLSDDIYTTIMYLKSKSKEEISLDRIITNTFKVRKDQNLLKLAGFTNEEVQLLRLFFNDKGEFYDTAG